MCVQAWRVICCIQVHWPDSAWQLSVSCSDLSRGESCPGPCHRDSPQPSPPPKLCVNWVLTQSAAATETRSPYCLIPQGDCSVTGGTVSSVTCLICRSHPVGLGRGRSPSSVMGSTAWWVVSWPSWWAQSIPSRELELSVGYDHCT